MKRLVPVLGEVEHWGPWKLLLDDDEDDDTDDNVAKQHDEVLNIDNAFLGLPPSRITLIPVHAIIIAVFLALFRKDCKK